MHSGSLCTAVQIQHKAAIFCRVDIILVKSATIACICEKSSANTVEPLYSGRLGTAKSSANTVEPLYSGRLGTAKSSANTVEPLYSGRLGTAK